MQSHSYYTILALIATQKKREYTFVKSNDDVMIMMVIVTAIAFSL